jgi:hypothetical protein
MSESNKIGVPIQFEVIRTGQRSQSIRMVGLGPDGGVKELLVFQAVYPLNAETTQRVKDLATALMRVALLAQGEN